MSTTTHPFFSDLRFFVQPLDDLVPTDMLVVHSCIGYLDLVQTTDHDAYNSVFTD